MLVGGSPAACLTRPLQGSEFWLTPKRKPYKYLGYVRRNGVYVLDETRTTVFGHLLDIRRQEIPTATQLAT
jgi:hypothetical protein